MTKGCLVFLVSTLFAGCGADSAASDCSLTIAFEGRPAVTRACAAGASAGITGPAAAQDNQINIGQRDASGDFFVLRLNLFLLSPPTTGVYDDGNVRSYLGTILEKTGHGWSLQPKFSPGSFQVDVKSMEEIGPEDDLNGGAFLGYRIHGTARATMPAPRSAPELGTATLTAIF